MYLKKRKKAFSLPNISLPFSKRKNNKSVEDHHEDIKVEDDSYNRLGFGKIYINGQLKKSVNISGLDKIISNNHIKIGLINCNNPNGYIWMSDFNIFRRELNQNEVTELYKIQSYSDYMKDFLGNPLEYNREYYVINAAHKNYYLFKNEDNYTNVYKRNNSLYVGVQWIMQNTSSYTIESNNIIRSNDNIWICTRFNNNTSYLHIFPESIGDASQLEGKYIVAYLSEAEKSLFRIQKTYNKLGYSGQILSSEGVQGALAISKLRQYYNFTWIVAKINLVFNLDSYFLKTINTVIEDSHFGCNWQFIPIDEGWQDQ
ncbi:hypothetical protein U728_352 [Clostridium botulinum 202F]|uniref:Botulinum neurotoxin n=1 Tax=Clostridium botulinum TaxID=1491 RepID=R4NG45_CLOBO|nr:botulinum neurotoxin [Clostridium botulinum]AIY79117.1 hypothetical protein U728_352 [Clostridium botulinum 202F]NFH01861.1 hypothetical protein [Clostridium botulinum]NFP39046.1 hypothetical protein [Clostridium botulinum]NFQ58306.1 hypothetical protein [Clostridium botulinum]